MEPEKKKELIIKLADEISSVRKREQCHGKGKPSDQKGWLHLQYFFVHKLKDEKNRCTKCK